MCHDASNLTASRPATSIWISKAISNGARSLPGPTGSAEPGNEFVDFPVCHRVFREKLGAPLMEERSGQRRDTTPHRLRDARSGAEPAYSQPGEFGRRRKTGRGHDIERESSR